MANPPIIQVEWRQFVTKQHYWDGSEWLPTIVEVSNTGLVRRKSRTDSSKYLYYTPQLHKKKYWRISIAWSGNTYHYKVHQLVWRAFNGDYDTDTYCIDHINGIGLDNRLCNLQLLTHEENSKKQNQDWSEADSRIIERLERTAYV